MRFLGKLIAAGALCAWALPALAHDVQAVIAEGPPRQVTLTYGDGEPFAYEAFELRASGAPLTDAPLQAGRTSETGVIVLEARPDEALALRLRAFSADGHGIDMLMPAPRRAAHPRATPAAALTPAATVGERLARGAAGVGVIGALYGLWLVVRRRRRPATATD